MSITLEESIVPVSLPNELRYQMQYGISPQPYMMPWCMGEPPDGLLG
jgi:hypothetical protein